MTVSPMIPMMMAIALGAATPAMADPLLGDFDYGWPVQRQTILSQNEAMTMAYIDARPENANGQTAVLLHGKNFCGGTWETTINALTGAGYRVIAPDQIGFCKSTKPARYQYGLHALADNTHQLLTALNIEKPVLVGHSMGGMLAIRYALQNPDELQKLVVVNPLGMEDWRAKGVPNATINQLYATELKVTRASIKAYQQSTYYAGTWKPEFDRPVDMLASMYEGPGGNIVAWHQALTADMVFNQPVVHEIGLKDNTAMGKNRANAELAATLGNYPVLAKEAQARIPNSQLITYPDNGHSPQMQDPERFNADLLKAIAVVP
jgi:pimeloyl-ACP methyl ester carboxylesterase